MKILYMSIIVIPISLIQCYGFSSSSAGPIDPRKTAVTGLFILCFCVRVVNSPNYSIVNFVVEIWNFSHPKRA